jgi:hypothetical protein
MSGGKPIPGMGHRGVPRLSDPGFRETSVNYVNKVLEAYPELFTVSLGMPDGFTQIDETDAIKWNRPERGNDGKFSDYVWDYWFYAAKELKKSHPDKYLACLAYGTYSEPPLQIEKLPDNVAITLCYGTATLFLPDGKRRESLRSSWVSMLSSKKLYIWDYYLFYRTDSSPRYPVFFTKLLQKDMRNLNGICEGKFIEMAPVTKGPLAGRLACPGLTHLIYYLQGKLYWDPDLDMAKLLDEYYAVFFGPAKKEMREFYEFAEEVWMRPESRSISTVSGFLKEKDVDRYFDILKRARERAGKDNVYDKRIAQIETEMEPLKKLFPNLKRSGPEFRAITVSEPLKIDGDFNKPFWSWNMWYPMKDLVTGENLQNNQSSVSFRMTADKAALVIAVVCKESRMDKIVAKTSRDDDADIFNDDVVEVYIETPERSYFKIAVNANGAVWDESQDVTIINRDTLPGLWNPGIKVAVKKGGNSWNVEIMIPTKDLGSIGPTQDFPWGINVCRSRLAGGASELSAISPTSVPCFLELSKLGNLWIR